jgi:hypothetical protein
VNGVAVPGVLVVAVAIDPMSAEPTVEAFVFQIGNLLLANGK